MSETIIRQCHVRQAGICVDGVRTFKKRYPEFSVLKLIRQGYTESELLAVSKDDPILRIIAIAKGEQDG